LEKADRKAADYGAVVGGAVAGFGMMSVSPHMCARVMARLILRRERPTLLSDRGEGHAVVHDRGVTERGARIEHAGT